MAQRGRCATTWQARHFCLRLLAAHSVRRRKEAVHRVRGIVRSGNPKYLALQRQSSAKTKKQHEHQVVQLNPLRRPSEDPGPGAPHERYPGRRCVILTRVPGSKALASFDPHSPRSLVVDPVRIAAGARPVCYLSRTRDGFDPVTRSRDYVTGPGPGRPVVWSR